jgi:hypothetical protein
MKTYVQQMPVFNRGQLLASGNITFIKSRCTVAVTNKFYVLIFLQILGFSGLFAMCKDVFPFSSPQRLCRPYVVLTCGLL